MIKFSLAFPTPLHQAVSEMARDFFLEQQGIDTVLVVNSCARGQGTPQSDLDMAVLVKPETSVAERQRLEVLWQQSWRNTPLCTRFEASHRTAHLHLDLIDGHYTPSVWDDGGGPDSFEIEIGNQVAYSAPIHPPGPYFQQLQQEWLPTYDEALRISRLQMVREACAYDLQHVPFFVGRKLYFQAFDRLYKAFQEFLQGLFLARRTYPIAYNKWIREQVVHWLELPELYRELPPLLCLHNLESEELNQKARRLEQLIEEWL